MNLGKNIMKACRERKISLTALARQSTVPKATLHGWVTGRKAMKLDQLRRVAVALEMPLYRLVFDEDDPVLKSDPKELTELFSGDVRLLIQKII